MKKILICTSISVGLALLLFLLSFTPFYQVIELKLYDLRMELRKPIPQTAVTFVEMDEAAIDALGRWPWPRDINAHLIQTLQSLGAFQVTFDVTFSQAAQLIVDKQKMESVFVDNKDIKNFIEQVSWGIKQGDIQSKEDIIWFLDQLQAGIDALEKETNARLSDTLKDTDEIFAQSLKKADVFMGYKFEVIYTAQDKARDAAFPELKKNILTWIRENPDKPFEELPVAIKGTKHFTVKEIEHIFNRLTIYVFLEEDLSQTLDDIAGRLNKSVQALRAHFNSVKEQLIKDKIEALIARNASIRLAEIVWHYEIRDAETIAEFKRVYARLIQEKTFIDRFGLTFETKQQFLKAIAIDPPLLDFTKNIKGAGYLNGIVDADGVLRKAPLFVQYHGNVFPHMGMAVVLDLVKPKKITFTPGKRVILEGALLRGRERTISIPIDKDGFMYINWAGRWKDTFTHISCLDIYRLYLLRKNIEHNAQLDPQSLTPEMKARLIDDQRRLKETEKILRKLIKGNICIIGLTAPGTHDYNPIPQEAAYPMVGTHGNIINTIVQEAFIRRLSPMNTLLTLIFLALLLGIALTTLPAIGGLVCTVVAAAAVFGTGVFTFNEGIWMDLLSPLALCGLSYLGVTSFKFATEEKEKRWIKNAFSHYVSKDVMEEILKDPANLVLGGERRIISVLFSDIRSFTTYSEKRTPEEVVAILNEYLDEMTKVIFANYGTLDKYVGDEIMAIYGAPHYEPPHISALQAVRTACQMMDRLHELQEQWKQEGKEPLDIGVGVNTGEMVVGNMGSTLRMDYTVIGDAVNLGARLEALTRDYNNHIIISEFTYQYIQDNVRVKPLEPVKVKGKDIPVMTYEVLGMNEEKDS